MALLSKPNYLVVTRKLEVNQRFGQRLVEREGSCNNYVRDIQGQVQELRGWHVKLMHYRLRMPALALSNTGE